SVDASRYKAVVYNPLPWTRDGLAVIGGRPRLVRQVPPIGYRALDAGQFDGPSDPAPQPQADAGVLENDFFRVAFGGGKVTSLLDKHTGRELVRPKSGGLGGFLYERFSADQCDRFMKDYCLEFPKWVTTQFTKPELPRDVPYRAAEPTGSGSPVVEQGRDYRALRFTWSAQEGLPCERLHYEIRLYDDLPLIDLSLALEGKRPESWPEAAWMCLPLNLENPEFRLSRLGGIVDPKTDILPGGNRHLLWLEHGLAVYGSDGYGVGICPIDAPLVSLGEPGCWKFSRDYLPEKADVLVNLLNNQWNTNFRLWNEGSWRQTVRLWTFDNYDPESSLIRQALEARFTLAASETSGSGSRGGQPAEATGLELSRRDVLVTSFGIDPQTQKRMLRLWEQAGKDGPCVITLPPGLGVSSAQPCDLRNRPLGDPIAVRDGRFQVEIRHNAPLNLDLIGSHD
ncbi:MAG: hypothetical protein ACYC6Y_08355, partial [Thermoguttaceae bacterium]